MTHTIEALPQQTPPTPDAPVVQSGISRRDFLRLSGLTAGAGLLAACVPPSPGTMAAAGAAADVARTQGPAVASAIRNHIEQTQRQKPDAGVETEFTQKGPTIADLFSGDAEVPQEPAEALKMGVNAALESLRRYNHEHNLSADIPTEVELLSADDFSSFLQTESAKQEASGNYFLYRSAEPILTTRLDGVPDSTRVVIDKDTQVIEGADPNELAFWAIDTTLTSVLRVQPPYKTLETPHTVKPQREAGTMQADWVWGWSMGGAENESQNGWEAHGFANGANEFAAMYIALEEARRGGIPDEEVTQLFARSSHTADLAHVAQFSLACGAHPLDLWKAGSRSDTSQSMEYLAQQHEKAFPQYANREQAMTAYVLAPDMMDPTVRDMIMPILLPTDSPAPEPVSEEPRQTIGVFRGLEPKIDSGAIKLKIDINLPRHPIS